MLLLGSILLVVLGVVPLPWGAALIVAGVVAEAAETGFWIWLSRRRRVAVGPETLIGQTVEVIRPCHPTGQVRLQGEIWRAHCESGADIGDLLRVRAVHGLQLLVEHPAPDG